MDVSKIMSGTGWSNAVAGCQACSANLPTVADLDALSCSDLHFRSDSAWASTLTATPFASGHYLYHDMGTGDPQMCRDYDWCGKTSFSGYTCNILPDYWLPDNRTDYGYVCLRNQGPGQVCTPQ